MKIERITWRKSAIGFLIAAMGFALAIVVPLAAQAQTPDGETPAEESVCDPLKADGVTKGLYGLCIAFCEAQDLDEYDKVNAAGEGLPGDKLLENYDRKRAKTDPDMPCLVQASECPCFNTEICKSTKGAACQIKDIVGIADIFTHTCDATDVCKNTAFLANDRCVQAPAKEPPTPGISTIVDARLSIWMRQGSCLAQISDSTGTRWNRVWRLHPATAELCFTELNNYDGNDKFDGTVDPCGL